MARKKAKAPKPDNSEQIASLKLKWFKLALLERLGKTKNITLRLDQIEQEIKDLSK